MTTIACLGWGSLVWDPRDLPIRRGWFADGPSIRVELARESRDGRVTFVLEASAAPVPALWAIVDCSRLNEAREALRVREGIPGSNAEAWVGSWSRGERSPRLVIDVAPWAGARGIDHVVWTALPPKWDGVERTPAAEEVTRYLASLDGDRRAAAERYVRRAPPQIDTAYRRRIEAALGWVATGA